jgi:hypothetical protein
MRDLPQGGKANILRKLSRFSWIQVSNTHENVLVALDCVTDLQLI